MKRTLLSACFLTVAFASPLQAQIFAQNPASLDYGNHPFYGLRLGAHPAIPSERTSPPETPAAAEQQDVETSNAAITDSVTEEAPKDSADSISVRQMHDLEEAADNFKERYPKTKVLGFSLTPLKGIYEATIGKEIIYFDKSARFIFSGHLFDLDKGIDLTGTKLRELKRVDISKLPLDLAIKEVKGDGRRPLVLFADVDCPYSRKLASTLENIDNVTIWTFLFPLTSLHPEAKAKSDAVWCNRDSNAALEAVYKGQGINSFTPSPLCSSPVEEIIRLGTQLGIAGTPTLINGAGDRASGAIPIDKLEAFISAGVQRSEE